MPGPAGNPNAVRRNQRVGLIQLPAEGRKKPAPKWPLPADPKLMAKIQLLEDEIELLEERDLDEDLSRTEKTRLSRTKERLAIAKAEAAAVVAGEIEIWKELWRTPQAVQWERLRWTRGVALYARHQAAGELGSLHDSKEARQRAHHLGLTPAGMKALMWVIVEDEVAAARQPAAATGTDGGRSDRRHLFSVAAATTDEEQPPVKKPPAKRPPAKKAAARKSAVKKATAAKRPAAKKTPAKKTPAKKTPAKKTPAKKAAATKKATTGRTPKK